MIADAAPSEAGGNSGPADGGCNSGLALQRILALAGRNALARVALAASELDRLESSPAARERLGSIRSAVDELDGVLHEIERLASPAREKVACEGTPIARTWNALVERLAPTLAARGIELERLVGGAEARVALPGLVLERILLACVRLAVASSAPEAHADGAPPLRLVVSDRSESESFELRLALVGAVQPARFELAAAERVELEVALAEWRCALIDESTATPSRIGLRLGAAT